MTVHDFYAKFYMSGILEDLEKWAMNKWNDVKRNPEIDWPRKARELREILESDKDKFHEIVSSYFHGNEKYSLTYYAKTQTILQNFIQRKMEELRCRIHYVLRREIRSYSPKEISKLDLSGSPKQAYVGLVHSAPDVWFHFPTETMNLLEMFTSPAIPLSIYSHFIQITFRLRKPYISLDDESLYIIDNPLVKDVVFKIPMIRPSTWKGALRWTAMKVRIMDIDLRSRDYVNERIRLIRLFGSEKADLENFLDREFSRKLGQMEGKRTVEVFKDNVKRYLSEGGNREGRVIFYPTFFDSIALDVIAPHDRRTRTIARMGPILFETAPEGSQGTFSLLYIPFDLLPALVSQNSSKRREALVEVKEDLEILKETIPHMLTTYGFAAKKTSGYGVAEDVIDFRLDSMEMKSKNFDEFKKHMESLIMNLGGTHE
ncbi:MAG: RAMP superfamily CRISPR-associated protein [Candidatus Methanomethyliaceae archaeon]